MPNFDCANCGSPLPVEIVQFGKLCPRCGRDPKETSVSLKDTDDPPQFLMDPVFTPRAPQVVHHNINYRNRDDADTKLLKVSAILLIWMVIILLAPCFIGVLLAINGIL